MSFRFKQFFIEDSQCAMKVGTDGILLGSWSQANLTASKNILDIGAGSGLLGLMLAQKCHGQSQISAVEIDLSAAAQAKTNVANSPWSTQILIIPAALQSFVAGQVAGQIEQFDWVVSNPPYFEHGQAFAKAREDARHTGSLSWFELVNSVSLLLKSGGGFECVLPFNDHQRMIELAEQVGLSLSAVLTVKSTERKAPIRSLLRFKKQIQSSPIDDQVLTIHQADGQYSADYKDLCRDFYLNF